MGEAEREQQIKIYRRNQTALVAALLLGFVSAMAMYRHDIDICSWLLVPVFFLAWRAGRNYQLLREPLDDPLLQQFEPPYAERSPEGVDPDVLDHLFLLNAWLRIPTSLAIFALLCLWAYRAVDVGLISDNTALWGLGFAVLFCSYLAREAVLGLIAIAVAYWLAGAIAAIPTSIAVLIGAWMIASAIENQRK